MFIYIKWICILIITNAFVVWSLWLNAVVIKDRGSEWGGILYYIHTELKCHNYAVIYNCNEYLWKQNISFNIIILAAMTTLYTQIMVIDKNTSACSILGFKY